MSEKTRIGRLPERAVFDRAEINAILDEGLVCHVAYLTDGRPVVIPTLYVRDADRILIHGSNSMGIAKAVRAGSPLSVAVTHIDGLVVARSAFNSSANYRSVVIHGRARLLADEEKKEAFDFIVDRLIPGRRGEIRPSTESEIRQTSIVELGLDEVSAKVRSGGPDDDPEDLQAEVWAGVVPMSTVSGEPVPDPGLRPGIKLPDYLRDFRR